MAKLSASTTFPTKWSKKVQRNTDATLVIAPLVDRRYEGELKKGGDTVKVSQWPDGVTDTNGKITDPGFYTRGSDVTDSSMAMGTRNLTVRQERAKRQTVDDVDDAQSIFNLIEGLSPRFAYAFRYAIDNYLWGYAGSFGAAEFVGSDHLNYSGSQEAGGNYGGRSAGTPPKSVSTGNFYTVLTQVSEDLNNRAAATDEVPTVILPPALCGAIRELTVLTGIQDSKTATQTVKEGIIGHVAGFNVMRVNKIIKGGRYWAKSYEDPTVTPSTHDTTAIAGTAAGETAYHCMFGCLGEAISFVKQINKVKVTDEPHGFGSNLLQLCVYGGMLLDPSSFSDAIWSV